MARGVLTTALAGLAFASAALAVPDATDAACVRGVAAGDRLWIRANPDARSSAVGAIGPRACDVTVVGPCRGGWCRVEHAGRSGWSNARYLDRRQSNANVVAPALAPAPIPAPVPAPAPVATGPGASSAAAAPTAPDRPPPVIERCVRGLPDGVPLKVRSGPSAKGTLLYGFHNGSCGVKITGPCRDDYCPVDYRGYRGWAERKFLQ